ncbi:promethin-like [Cynoglossus semilaevis]|uniref:promethin-like n=1 Tax=Cynoglossus semilaevis TaxID=244447 RepID=UPI0004967A1E|nr:promethin-like [Cynoglossus semilaevis]XP_008336230.3 promethin-like [Cynoglossus semilaevis]
METEDRSSVGDWQQQVGRWTTQIKSTFDDPHPQVSQLMNTSVGQYLGSHPLVALTVMVFSAMAALPVGLFLIFALVTMVISAVGFVFVEVTVLFLGGMSLLCVLSGIALFSVFASLILMALYITISHILVYYPQLTKVMNQ